MPYIGLDAKLYYNTGTHASPTWVLISKAVDVAANVEQAAVSVASRSSRWNAYLPGLKDAEVTFGYRVGTGTDTVLAKLVDMILDSQDLVEVAVMDQLIATVGSQGLRMFAVMQSHNLSQGLGEGAIIEISLKPAYKEESSAKVDPDWYVVAS